MQNIEPDTVHVAVAVIVQNGRVLISKRADHVHQGGLWEFPGGKVEPGEKTQAALHREIQEELGLNIKVSRPLIKLVHHYSDKSVFLEIRLITEFDGQEYAFYDEQLGREGQVVKWVKLEQLDNYQFPVANKAIVNAIRLPDSYLISPDCCDNFSSNRMGSVKMAQFLQQFSASVRKHSLVQLRIKSLYGDMLNETVKQVCEIARKSHTRILLNSALLDELAGLKDEMNHYASGVHLTGHHLHEKKFIENYRRYFPEKILAASCHNKKDIERANQLELDFIVISPVQQTTSHPQQAPLGWERFKTLTDLARTPVFALGGMSQTDIIQAQSHGAQGIAAIRSLWSNE